MDDFAYDIEWLQKVADGAEDNILSVGMAQRLMDRIDELNALRSLLEGVYLDIEL